MYIKWGVWPHLDVGSTVEVEFLSYITVEVSFLCLYKGVSVSRNIIVLAHVYFWMLAPLLTSNLVMRCRSVLCLILVSKSVLYVCIKACLSVEAFLYKPLGIFCMLM